MTAEVSVMNRIGVALAADSAVTVRSGGTTGKIYTSADKLFCLVSGAPIGIMVYGSANHVRVPWETIIKEFRKAGAGNAQATVFDYRTAFINFLDVNGAMFSDADERQSIRRELQFYIHTWIRADLKNALGAALEADEKDELDQKDVKKIVAAKVKDLSKSIDESPFAEGFSLKDVTAAQEQYRDISEETVNIEIGELPITPSVRKNLCETLCSALVRRVTLASEPSGIVIAGFGTSEYLPRLEDVEISGRVLGRTRISKSGSATIDEQNDSVVKAFAQTEGVNAFMKGVHHQLLSFFERSTKELMKQLTDITVDKVHEQSPELADSLKKAIEPALKTASDNLDRSWEERVRKHWEPVIDVIAYLPKDELAATAEALVNLTGFRKQVTPEQETVGGPIDVAIITKGDGFVWMRRKNYFESDLNPITMGRLNNGDS